MQATIDERLDASGQQRLRQRLRAPVVRFIRILPGLLHAERPPLAPNPDRPIRRSALQHQVQLDV